MHSVRKSNGSSIKSNFIYNMAYQILSIILPLITAPYVTRVLGATNLGVYSYSQAFANYFYLFAMLGVNNYGNRSIARVRDDQQKLNRTFWEIFSFQLLVGAVVSIAYILYVVVFVQSNRLIYILQFFYVLSGMLDVNWACFGLEKFKLTAARSMIARIVMAAAVFLLIKDESDLWIYTLILSLQYLISAAVIWPFILKQISFVKVTWEGISRHIKPNLMLFLPVIAISLYNIMDKLMLGYFSTEEEVAFYTYAERIATIPTTVILALDNVMMPRMSNLYATHREEKAANLMDSVMMFAMFMSSAMAFGLAGVGEQFATWFYGSAFSRCGFFIVLLCPTILFKGCAGALRTQYIIPTQKDKIYLASLISGAAVNLILNALLIPSMNGVGAIIGTIAAEFSVCFVQFFMTRRDIPIIKYVVDFVGFFVIGTAMYFVVRAFDGVSSIAIVNIVIQVSVGAIVFVILGLLYMLKIRKNPVLVNEGLKMLKIKYRFK